MADSKSRLEKSIKARNEVRIEHLLKLYFYPEAEREREGWERSVYSSLNKVPLLKNGRRPDFQFLRNQLWTLPFEGKLRGEMDRRVFFISGLIQDYEPPEFPLADAVVDDCYGICREYSEWLADMLSLVGFLSLREVGLKVEDLLKKSIYVK
jgi:hypothetical protein